MTFSKIKLFGFLALSYSLIACGQTPVSTASNATPNAIAQTTTAAQPTETPVTVAKSPEPQSSVTQVPEKSPESQSSAVASTKVETAIAQSQDTSTDTREETRGMWQFCQLKIRQSVARLEAVPNVKVTTDEINFSELLVPYPNLEASDPNYRHRRERRYIFGMEGSGVEPVWKSPDLMNKITQEITNACVSTAAVTFARDRTSDSVTVGLFPDGSIKKFTCAPDLDDRTRTRPPLTWGQQACDL